jgi:DNA-binding CsgD family transcriptional regulator
VSEPANELVAVVNRSSVASLLVRLPSTVILAASRSAGDLAGVDPAQLVGATFEELTADDPPGAIELLRTGRITGYETQRAFKGRDGSLGRRVQVWVRVLDQPPPIEFAVGVLWPAGTLTKGSLPPPGPDEPHAVFGTISPELLVERISEDVSIFGLAATDLVGAPILRLVTADSAADALVGLAEAALRAAGVCTMVRVDGISGAVPAQLFIRRLVPSMSFAFSLVVPGDDGDAGPMGAEETLRMLGRGLRALDTGRTADDIDRTQPGTEKLSSRELEIVARLVGGDRVPAIARALFLTQGTIRNHLSNAYRKLGVASQQELIDLYRGRSST